jgi:hypothetical protein
MPCLTITAGITQMSGGDTLLVEDGTYVNDPVNYVPPGSAGAYTTIKSVNVGGAIIDMSSVTAAWVDAGIMITHNYIQVEGFMVKGNPDHDPDTANGPVTFNGSYGKGIRLAVYGAPSAGNSAAFGVVSGDHNLLEECWVWGTGRYKFIIMDSTNTIVRRCVARHDYHGGNDGWSHQEALFVNYDSTNTLFQNCIGLDSGIQGDSTQKMYGGFWDENNDNSVDKTGKVEGSILLNIQNALAGHYDKASGNRTITNTVIWDIDSGGYVTCGRGGVTSYPPAIRLSNMTIGKLAGVYPGVGDDSWALSGGVGAGDQIYNNSQIADSIVYGANSFGYTGSFTSSHNVFYQDGSVYGQGAGPGTNDRTTIDPKANGLRYLPRIEDSSVLSTAGTSGRQVGAEILYQIGTSESLYGDAGYDSISSVQLWPFPNEAKIKSDLSSYSGPGPSGMRGFCAGTSIDGSPQTLTKYIWEYLGNQIPPSIYGTTVAADAGFGQSAGGAIGTGGAGASGGASGSGGASSTGGAGASGGASGSGGAIGSGGAGASGGASGSGGASATGGATEPRRKKRHFSFAE